MRRILCICVMICVGVYCLLWIFSLKKHAVSHGISFSHTHAAYLGLDWREVYTNMLERFQPRHVRVAALWNEVQPSADTFDFSSLDFLMGEAEKRRVRITLVVGQKAPRWPECHIPAWAAARSGDAYREAVFQYMKAVVERYRGSSALEIWQVENEPFIGFQFGECAAFRRDIIAEEVALLRELDGTHSIMITDSGELSTWQQASRHGDVLGTTLYRVVQMQSGAIFTYDWLPPAAYTVRAFLAGKSLQKWYIAEAQAEPWFASENPKETTLAAQEKTFSPKRFLRTARYVERTGASRVYWWGVEWWYYADKVFGTDAYLRAADEIFAQK
jgi:hypothetical protein